MLSQFRITTTLGRRLEELGVSPAKVLRQAGLPKGLLDQEKILVSTEEPFAFYRGLAEASRDPAIGLKLGTEHSTTTFDSTDFRNISPRFAADARAANLALVELLKRIAESKGATPAQVTLAWLLAQKPWIVPISGTRKPARLNENIGAASLELKPNDLREIENGASKITVQGARLPEAVLKMTVR